MFFIEHCKTSSKDDEKFAKAFGAVDRWSRGASEPKRCALTRGHCFMCAIRVGRSANTDTDEAGWHGERPGTPYARNGACHDALRLRK